MPTNHYLYNNSQQFIDNTRLRTHPDSLLWINHPRGGSDNLHEGSLEARRIRNEVNRLDREGWDWNDIQDTVVE